MGPIKHLLVSTAVAGMSHSITKDYQMAFACIASGVLVDADHMIEYRNYCKEYCKKWDWKEISTGEYFNMNVNLKVSHSLV